MGALRTIWNFFLLFSLFSFAQLVGILIFFRLRQYQHFLAHFFGLFTPLFLYVAFSWLIFIYRYYQVHPNERCGGQLVAASMIILTGAALQIFCGVIAQLAIHNRVQTCVAAK